MRKKAEKEESEVDGVKDEEEHEAKEEGEVEEVRGGGR